MLVNGVVMIEEVLRQYRHVSECRHDPHKKSRLVHQAQGIAGASAALQKFDEAVRGSGRGTQLLARAQETLANLFAQLIVERDPRRLGQCERVEDCQRVLAEELRIAVELQAPPAN